MSILQYLKEELSSDIWDLYPNGDLRRLNIDGVDFEYEVNDDGVYIEYIGVPLSMRGKGLARKILTSFLSAVDSNGYTTTLMVLPGDAQTTEDILIKFYETLGFKISGNDKGNNKILMVRQPS